jgi:hypothetical protein
MKKLKIIGLLLALPWIYLWSCIEGWRPFQSPSGHMAGLGEGLLTLGFILALFVAAMEIAVVALVWYILW